MGNNTQKPVVWMLVDEDGDWEFNSADEFSCGRSGGKPLYELPPMPRDVLMTFGAVVMAATKESLKEHGSAFKYNAWEEVDLAAIADRYASQVQPETVNQQQAGVYRKFNVSRTDGRDQPGGDRHGAEYFVLDVTHDKFAKQALAAYAAACRDAYPSLADDMVRRYAIAAEAAQPVEQPRCACGDSFTSDAVCANCLAAQQPASSQPVAVPDGWRMVPIEPTREMIAAFRKEEGKTFPVRYAAMLSAAQKPEGVPEVKDKYSDWPELATVKLQWATDYTTGWGRRGADGKIRPIYGDDTREPLDMNCWIIIAEREAAGQKGGA